MKKRGENIWAIRYTYWSDDMFIWSTFFSQRLALDYMLDIHFSEKTRARVSRKVLLRKLRTRQVRIVKAHIVRGWNA